MCVCASPAAGPLVRGLADVVCRKVGVACLTVGVRSGEVSPTAELMADTHALTSVSSRAENKYSAPFTSLGP